MFDDMHEIDAMPSMSIPRWVKEVIGSICSILVLVAIIAALVRRNIDAVRRCLNEGRNPSGGDRDMTTPTRPCPSYPPPPSGGHFIAEMEEFRGRPWTIENSAFDSSSFIV